MNVDPPQGEPGLDHLLPRLREDDDDAWCLIVEAMHGKLVAYARSWIHEKHMAEDIVQEAYLATYRNIDRVTNIKAYLYTAVRRKVIDLYRQLRVRITTIGEDALLAGDAISDEPTGEMLLELAEDAFWLRSAINRLVGDTQREVIRLTMEMEGVSDAEIAERLGIKREQVKSNRSKAIRNLCKMWEAERGNK